MNGNQILSLVGIIIVIAGIFCPIATVPPAGNLTLWGNGDAEGAVVLGISIAILICIFITMDKGSIFLGVINLAIIAAVFIGFQIKISGGGGGAAIQLQWGWALLALGSFLLLFGAWEKNFVMVIACIVGAGLMTMVLPASSAGGILKATIITGKFHGMIAATTPSGRRWVTTLRFSLSSMVSCGRSRVAK